MYGKLASKVWFHYGKANVLFSPYLPIRLNSATAYFEAFLDLMCFKGGASQLALPPAHPTRTPTHFVRYPMMAYDARGHRRLSFLV